MAPKKKEQRSALWFLGTIFVMFTMILVLMTTLRPAVFDWNKYLVFGEICMKLWTASFQESMVITKNLMSKSVREASAFLATVSLKDLNLDLAMEQMSAFYQKSAAFAVDSYHVLKHRFEMDALKLAHQAYVQLSERFEPWMSMGLEWIKVWLANASETWILVMGEWAENMMFVWKEGQEYVNYVLIPEYLPLLKQW